jgi:hypothetical protein
MARRENEDQADESRRKEELLLGHGKCADLEYRSQLHAAKKAQDQTAEQDRQGKTQFIADTDAHQSKGSADLEKRQGRRLPVHHCPCPVRLMATEKISPAG